MTVTKNFPKLLLPLALNVGLALTSAFASAATPERPNILFIMADDLGWMDTGVYGSRFYETPHIDRLAGRGMRFTNAYSANPLCSPTRASILSGVYPTRVGLTGPWAHHGTAIFEHILPGTAHPTHPFTQQAGPAGDGGGTRMDIPYYTYAEALKDAGYRTAHFGKWHVGPHPYGAKEQGFDVDIPEWHGPGPAGAYLAPWAWRHWDRGEPGEHIEDRMAQEAIQFMTENKEGPFLVNYWAFSVHSPYDSERDVKPEKLQKYIPLAEQMHEENYPQHNAVMGGMVATFDHNVGRLLDALDELGIRENTIVVFFSDNGGVIAEPRATYNHPEPVGQMTSNHPLRSGKASIYEGGVRVPLIIDWPGVTEPGAVSDQMTMSMDLYPTLLEMAGVDMFPGLPVDGVSLVPALRGQPFERGPLFVHFPHGGKRWEGFQPSTSVREDDWKLIRFYHDTADQGHRIELYNLREDIGENNNLAAERPAKVAYLDRLIDDWLIETEATVPQANPNFDPAAAEERWGDDWRNPMRYESLAAPL